MNKFLIIWGMLCTVTLFSCTEKVDLDPRDRNIVVHAILKDTTVQTVQLYYTSYISENYNAPLEEAQVYIERVHQDSIVVERHNFYKESDGVWKSNFVPVQYAIYKLTVSVPGKELMTATTRFPLRYNFKRLESAQATKDKAIYNGTELKRSSNYECIRLYSYMDYIPETNSYQMATNHIYDYFYFGGDKEEREYGTWMFQDFKYSGRYAISRLRTYMSSNDSINKTDYNRLTDITVYLGGAEHTLSPGREHWIGGFRIVFYPARLYGDDPVYSYTCIHPLSYVIIRSISKEYELYIKDVIAKSIGLNKKEETDMTHLWEKDDIYTNITNGLGIFAAECRYEAMIKDWQHVNYPPIWERYDITIPGWND